jgi:hypothetical protein
MTKLSKAEAAQELGITPGAVSELVRDGSLHPTPSGDFDFLEIQKVWCRRLPAPDPHQPPPDLAAIFGRPL